MKQFTWIGPLSGIWSTPSNWNDITDGVNPSAIAPGSLDLVTFNSPSSSSYQSIGGVGQSASLTLNGQNSIVGTISVGGTLTNNGLLQINSGGSLSAGSLVVAAPVTVNAGGTLTAVAASGSSSLNANGGEVVVSGTASGSFSTLSAEGGTLQIGALIDTVPLQGKLIVGSASVIEIGSAGTAAAGALTVDAGATLSLAPVTSPGNAIGFDEIEANLVDKGTISGADMFVDGTISGSGLIEVAPAQYNNGQGTIITVGSLAASGAVAAGSLTFKVDTAGSMTLSGTVGSGNTFDLQNGAVLTFGNTLATANTINIASSDSLTISGAVAAGSTIDIQGTGDVLTFGPLASMVGTVTGFGTSDVIVVVNGESITSALYAAGTGSAPGTLKLLDGTVAVGTVLLTGSYAGETFLANALNSSTAEIVVAPTQNGGTSSPGTPTPDQYVWSGPLAGTWATASNWSDTTAALTPAAIAPGSLDLVTFNSPSSVYQFISGTGQAASLTLNGENAVNGTISVGGTLTDNGALLITSGGSLTLGSLAVAASLTASAGGTLTAVTASGSGSIAANAGKVVVSGTASGSFGTLSASNGGSLQFGGLTVTTASGFLSVDDTSVVEIGTAGTAAAGALTVDPTATLALSGATLGANNGLHYGVQANVVDNGLISGSFVYLTGTVSGTGVIEAAATRYNNGSTYGSYLDVGEVAAGSLTFKVDNSASMAVGGAIGGGNIFDVQSSAALTLAYTVAAGNAVNLSSNDELAIAGTIAAGTTINLSGTNDTLDLNAIASMGATINGFGTSDIIVLPTPSITNANYTVGIGTGTGALVLQDGTTTLATITIAGSYTGETFLTTIVSAYESQISLVPAQITGTNGTLTVAALSGATVPLSQITQNPLYTNNGTLDVLTVTGSGTVQASGTLQIGDLVVGSSSAIVGPNGGGGNFSLSGGKLTTDPVTIDAGGTLSGYGTITGNEAVSGVIIASGGTLEITGTISGAGTLHIAAGATLKLDQPGGSAPVVFDQPGTGNLQIVEYENLSPTIIGFAPGSTITIADEIGYSISSSVQGTTTIVEFLSGGQTLTGYLSLSGSYPAGALRFNSATGVLTDVGTPPAAPTIAGTVAGQTVSASGSIDPFALATITDLNVGVTDTLTVSLSAAGNGTLSGLGGGTYNATTGIYTVAAPPASIQGLLDGLVFTPNPTLTAPGTSTTTGFTISVNDGVAPAATDSTTSVIATATAVLPVVTGIAAFSNATLAPFAVPATVGDTIDFGIAFNEAVVVTGTPTLLLSNGGTATYYGVTPTKAGQTQIGSGSATVAGTDAIFDYSGAVAGTGATTPVIVTLPAGTGRIVTFPTVAGTVSLTPGSSSNGDGYTYPGLASSVISGAAGLSGITSANVGFLAGVFLNGHEGTAGQTAPAALDLTQPGAESALSTSPLIDQSFFIGDGLTGTGSGSLQSIVVPDGATELVLGYIDANGYSGVPGAYFDNSGSLTVGYSISKASGTTVTNAALFDYVPGFSATPTPAVVVQSISGGTIADAAGNALSRSLFGINQFVPSLAIPTITPTLTSITQNPQSGTLAVGQTDTITLGFNEPITVSGTAAATLALALDDGGTASYVGGSGTRQLSFVYTVAATDLGVASLAVTAVTQSTGFVGPVAVFNGVTIQDANGTPAALSTTLLNQPGPLVDTTTVVTSPNNAVHFIGNSTYTQIGNSVTIAIPELLNTSSTAPSGSMAVELWYLAAPYTGAPDVGFEVSAFNYGADLAPGGSIAAVTTTQPVAEPPPGTYDVALLLKETAGNGTVTDDWVDYTPTATITRGTLIPASHYIVDPATFSTVQVVSPPPGTGAVVSKTIGQGGVSGAVSGSASSPNGENGEGGGDDGDTGDNSGSGSPESGAEIGFNASAAVGPAAPLLFLGSSALTISNSATLSVAVPSIESAAGGLGTYDVDVTLGVFQIGDPGVIYNVANARVGSINGPNQTIAPSTFQVDPLTLSSTVAQLGLAGGPYGVVLQIGDLAGDAFSSSVLSYNGVLPNFSSPITLSTVALPSTPSALQVASMSPNAASLSWTGSSASGGGAIADYVIYRNGVAIDHATGTSYTATGLAAATAYSFAVAAEDSAGASFQSNAVSVTTPAAPDVGVPDLSTLLSGSAGAAYQQALAQLRPSGAAFYVVDVAAGTATTPAVAGVLNGFAVTVAGAGATEYLPAGYQVGYLINGGASTLADAIGNALLVAAATSPGTLIGNANDTLIGGDTGATFVLPTGAETVFGGVGANLFELGASNALANTQGTDTIVGTTGSATVNAAGAPLYFGGPGTALFNALGATATLVGGGAETVNAGAANALVFGGSGPLTFNAGSGVNTVVGGIPGGTVTGGSGTTLFFAEGPTTYTAGTAADTVVGFTGSLTATGGSTGTLFFTGIGGNNHVTTGTGASTIIGFGTNDLLTATGPGANVIAAYGVAETINGAQATGNNTFFAFAANDVVEGGAGATAIESGVGNHTLVAGSGATLFELVAGTANRAITLQSFTVGQDYVQLQGYDTAMGAAAVQNATTSGGNTVVALSDGTHITFLGVNNLTVASFIGL